MKSQIPSPNGIPPGVPRGDGRGDPLGIGKLGVGISRPPNRMSLVPLEPEYVGLGPDQRARTTRTIAASSSAAPNSRVRKTDAPWSRSRFPNQGPTAQTASTLQSPRAL